MRLSGDGGPVELSRVLPPVVTDVAMLSVFRSVMEAIILSYCVVVAAASASITTVLPVAAAERALKWPSNYSMKESGAPVMWIPGVPVVVGGEISWMRAAECAEPKTSLRPVTSLHSCSSALWRGRK